MRRQLVLLVALSALAGCAPDTVTADRPRPPRPAEPSVQLPPPLVPVRDRFFVEMYAVTKNLSGCTAGTDAAERDRCGQALVMAAALEPRIRDFVASDRPDAGDYTEALEQLRGVETTGQIMQKECATPAADQEFCQSLRTIGGLMWLRFTRTLEQADATL